MAEHVEGKRADGTTPSAGATAAAVVRGVGARTADLTEDLARAAGAALAGTVRGVSRTWAGIVGGTIDALLGAATAPARRRRPRPGAPGERRPGAPCVDLVDVESREQIDEALTRGLAAAAPPRPSRQTA
jgi:hypothetical protein